VVVTQSSTARPDQLIAQLRQASSQTAMRALGFASGFRIEDAAAFAVVAPTPRETALLSTHLRAAGASQATLVELEGVAPLIAAIMRQRRGISPTRARYKLDTSERVAVEAFEFHVVEHCNLRCANCCNMSPLVADKVLSLATLTDLIARMRQVIVADVCKIMGGEPLLHPNIVKILTLLKNSGLGHRVRLFTNGLLLGTQPEAFWQALEDLTISSYASAPVKPGTLALANEKAQTYGFALNVKQVTEFSQVLSPAYEHDGARTQTTFDECWLRHRCLIARGDKFYMCTRSAYAPDFFARVDCEEPPSDHPDDEGLPLASPTLAQDIMDLLNRDAPLAACRYCLGGAGPTAPHVQLTRDDVAAGRLTRRGS
jgi:organic radical activating enzyme